jgi:outer membrane protein OmpA-like peptidoglycan-associated protein
MAAEQRQVLGEDSPAWLIGVFGLIGVLVAGAAAWLWLAAPAATSQAVATVAAQAPATPAAPPECPAPVMVPFESGFSRLDSSRIARLAASTVQRAQQDRTVRLVVLGHADATGHDKQNFLLSYHRAQVVSAWLVDAGVPADRVRIRAAGSQEPIKGLDPEAGDNRRVGIFITGLPGCPDL